MKNNKEFNLHRLNNFFSLPIMKIVLTIIVCLIFSGIYVLKTAISLKDIKYDKEPLGLLVTDVQGAETGYLDKAYPINSIFISVSNTNPGTIFGGTWVAFGSGRTLVGMGSNGTNNYTTVAATGGAVTHSITVSNLPVHNHSIPALSGSTTAANNVGSTSTNGSHHHQYDDTYNAGYYTTTGGGKKIALFSTADTSSDGSHSHKLNIPSLTVSTTASNTNGCTNCSGTALNTQDPYVTVYMWKRTA